MIQNESHLFTIPHPVTRSLHGIVATRATHGAKGATQPRRNIHPNTPSPKQSRKINPALTILIPIPPHPRQLFSQSFHTINYYHKNEKDKHMTPSGFVNRKWEIREIRDASVYLLIVLATYFSCQTLIVIIHEHIHSTTAYLLGNMADPFAIYWGNPITLTGWDEGVEYSALFAAGEGVHAAIIAVMPLIFHAIVVTGGIYLLLSNTLLSRALLQKKWAYHLVFWFIIVNLAELIAYMPIRAFSLHGDIGNINHGLGLNPWITLVVGTPLVLIMLYYLLRHVLPGMYTVVAGDSPLKQYVILITMAFFLFLFTSGIRMAQAQEWLMSLISFLAFALVILSCRPGLRWVVAEEQQFTKKIKQAGQEMKTTE